MKNLFLFWLAIHLLTDFLLQTNWLVNLKRNSRIGTLFHVSIFVILTVLFLPMLPSEYRQGLFAISVVLAGLHWLQDEIRVDWLKTSPEKDKLGSFLLDQASHILLLFLATIFYPVPDSAFPWTPDYALIFNGILLTASVFPALLYYTLSTFFGERKECLFSFPYRVVYGVIGSGYFLLFLCPYRYLFPFVLLAHLWAQEAVQRKYPRPPIPLWGSLASVAWASFWSSALLFLQRLPER